MIEIQFVESGKKLSLCLKGHAGYAEQGRDIVCACASILAYTVAQFVMQAESEGDLNSPAEIKLRGGDTVITCEPKAEAIPVIENIYLFAKVGFALLERNHPQYVRLLP